jgi:FMN-dependent NADH-azoreductase
LRGQSKKIFKVTKNGPVRLLKGKQTIQVITSGGRKLGSDIDFVSSCLGHVLAFIGINDLTIINGS